MITSLHLLSLASHVIRLVNANITKIVIVCLRSSYNHSRSTPFIRRNDKLMSFNSLLLFLGQKSSRLLTVTIDGKLDVWDFDSTKHVIFKDRANTYTPFDRAFDLLSNPTQPDMFLALSDKKVMVKLD